METSLVFSIANTIVLPMWLLLIVAPKWSVTQFLTDYKIIPILLSLVYVFYMGGVILQGIPLDFSSLASVGTLFTHENALLAGWVHYLAFDLLVGSWMVTKNRQQKLHPLLLAPCLIATFMLGPVGFLLFTLITKLKNRIS